MSGRTTEPGRWAVPLRRVFPWWYVAGAVVTAGVLIVLNPDGGSQGMVAFWGPTIGIAIRDREKSARTRLKQGLPVDRVSLLSPPWLEPVCAALLSVFAVSGGLLLDALLGNRTFVTV